MSVERSEQIGSRIRKLRKWLRISQTTIAEYLGIPRTAVSAFETGKRDLSVKELVKLSDLLRCNPNALLGVGRSPIASTQVTFKARANSGPKMDDHDFLELENFAAHLKQRLMLLDNNLPIRFAPEKFVTSNLPQAAAKQLAASLALEAPVDIYKLILELGLYLRFSALSGLAGALVRESVGDKEIYGVLVNSDQSEERMRFSAAHEVAHYILRHFSESEIVPSPMERWKDPVERDADSFASELLMPSESLRKNLENVQQLSSKDVFALSKRYSVSYQAMLYRLLSLSFISQVQFDSFSKESVGDLKREFQELNANASKKFDPTVLRQIVANKELSFLDSADWVRWLQEVAIDEYRRSTAFDERSDEIKQIYETVALWVAKNFPMTSSI